MEAFEDAIDIGCKWAELDIWATADSKMVVTHDRNLKNCYGIDLNVTSVTLAELRTHVSKEQVPTLEDVWEVAKNKIKLQIEVKDINTVTPLLNFFSSNDCCDKCIVISFNQDALKQIKQANSSITCGLLANSFNQEMLQYDWADIISILYNFATEQDIADTHSAGKKYHVWTVDTLKDMRQLFSIGVDSITTNKPNLSVLI